MTAEAGQILAHYRLVRKIGEGGMGVVYDALDTKLGRHVAIKVLPVSVAQDAAKLQRFEREAKLLAALDHPNIAAIHDFDAFDGVHFLVLELVPGETLAERMARGPMPLGETLEICRQVLDALGAAHDRGIVHRDLKPANIKITPAGRVKVLDFGLAMSLAPDPAPADLTQSPTLLTPATRTGIILGTPGYMSPEQARGRPVDRRSDLWSFGCILYEMLASRTAFGGDTVPDSLVAVLTREPDWAAIPRATPAPVLRLLRRCLEKDVERRLVEAREARVEIETALAARGAPGSARHPIHRSVMAVVAAALAFALALLVLDRFRSTPVAGRPQLELSQITFAEGIEDFPAWSPDGTRLVYSADTGRLRAIHLKDLKTTEETPLTTGESDDIQPAWSPDGKTILFVRARQAGKKLEPGDVFGQYNDGDVWALDLATRQATKLIENAFNPDYARDGRHIAVDASWAGPRRIWAVDGNGHNPQQLTTDTSEAVVHVRPRFSPEGGTIVFQNMERTRFDIRVVDTTTKRLTWVTNDVYQDIDPVWSPSGSFIYFSSNRGGGINIWRIPVSKDGASAGTPEQMTLGAGQDLAAAISYEGRSLAFSILRQIADIWKLPVVPETGHATGPPQEVIATTREDSRGAWSPDGREIAFNSDRTGQMNIWIHSLADASTRPLTRGPGGDFQPSWSPDGRRIAFFSSRSGNVEIWTVDVQTGALRQLTTSSSIDVNPFFSPEGTRIAFQSDRSGRLEVWVMNADGTAPRQLTNVGVTGHFLRWTRDGRSILFRCICGSTPRSMEVPADGGEPQPIAEIAGGSHMSFSPDGSLVMDVVQHKTLWVSPLKEGRPEKVFEFPDPEVRIDYPVWSPDGRFILFDHFRPEGGDIWLMEKFEER
jgi:eukaryotic-like serine/threonine-protein kinase